MEPSTVNSLLRTAREVVKYRRARSERGFTLIEMLIVIAIIGILTIVILLSQKNFNVATLLTDTAYTIALSIRESQSFGLSSRVYSGVYNAGYGVHFGAITNPPSSYNPANSYVVFADINPSAYQDAYSQPQNCPDHTETNPNFPDARPGDCYYDSGDGLVQMYTLGGGYTISAIVGTLSNGQQVSFAPSGGSLDIVYERPNTQAVITMNNASIQLSSATIEITSPQGGTRCVLANSLGEVSVSSTCP